MRKYWKVATMHWELRMVYRADAILEAAGHIITMLVSIALWIFAFQHVAKDSIGGYKQREMVIYLLISGLITSTLWYSSQGDSVIAAIRKGRFSKYLVKPTNFTVHHFIAKVVSDSFRLLFSVMSIVVILLIFDIPFELPIQWFHIPFFLLFLVLAVLFQFLLFYGTALLAFWMEEVWGITFVMRVFADVAAGTFIPLSLFAPFWQRLFDALPFKYVVSVPVNILIGKVGLYEIMSMLIGGVAWLIVLAALTTLIWKRGVRHYSAVGD